MQTDGPQPRWWLGPTLPEKARGARTVSEGLHQTGKAESPWGGGETKGLVPERERPLQTYSTHMGGVLYCGDKKHCRVRDTWGAIICIGKEGPRGKESS